MLTAGVGLSLATVLLLVPPGALAAGRYGHVVYSAKAPYTNETVYAGRSRHSSGTCPATFREPHPPKMSTSSGSARLEAQIRDYGCGGAFSAAQYMKIGLDGFAFTPKGNGTYYLWNHWTGTGDLHFSIHYNGTSGGNSLTVSYRFDPGVCVYQAGGPVLCSWGQGTSGAWHNGTGVVPFSWSLLDVANRALVAGQPYLLRSILVVTLMVSGNSSATTGSGASATLDVYSSGFAVTLASLKITH